MFKTTTLAICGLSAIALTACSSETEPMAQMTTPMYAKDGTIIEQPVVVRSTGRTPEATGIISENDNADVEVGAPGADGMDDDSDDDMDG